MLFDVGNPKKPRRVTNRESSALETSEVHVQYRDYGILLPDAESWMEIPGYPDINKAGIRSALSKEQAVISFIISQMPKTGKRIFNQLMGHINLHGGIDSYVCKVPDSRDLCWSDGGPITPSDDGYMEVQEIAFAQEIARMRRFDDYHIFIGLSKNMLLNLRKARQKRITENTYG